MATTPIRRALQWAALAGAAAAAATRLGAGRGLATWAPGELDLVLAARSWAAGRPLPGWAAAVHPDAPGTWVEGLLLAPWLWLGDGVALDLLGAAHAAMWVGAGVGLAARLGGGRAAAATAAALLGAPFLLGAFTRTMGTTAEAAGLQMLGLWALWEHRRSGRSGLLLGVLLGFGTFYSRHGLLLAGVALPASRQRWRVLLGIGGTLAAGEALRWVSGVPPGVQVLARRPTELLSLLGPDAVLELLRHGPLALAPPPLPAPVQLVHATLLVAVLLGAARALRAGPRLIALYGWACAAALLLAGELMGYPAGYRYYVNAWGPLAVAAGATTAAYWTPRRLALPVAALLASTLFALPRSGRAELDRRGAAFFAGQHRVHLSVERPLHAHAALLWPWLRPSEEAAFAQGYGLHLAREFTAVSKEAQAVTRAGEHGDGRAVHHAARASAPATWVGAADALDERIGDALLRGLGLGLGEDARLDASELRLLGAVPAHRRDEVWFGIGGALGEQPHPLTVDGGWSSAAGLQPDPRAFARGVHETAGRSAEPWLPTDAPPSFRAEAMAEPPRLPRGGFAMAHPLRFGGPIRPR